MEDRDKERSPQRDVQQPQSQPDNSEVISKPGASFQVRVLPLSAQAASNISTALAFGNAPNKR
jgi:hypothetical protein